VSEFVCFDGVWRHFQQYFSYIVAVSFIGGGNRRTRRKPVASHWQTLSNNAVCLALIMIITHKISGDRHWLQFNSKWANFLLHHDKPTNYISMKWLMIYSTRGGGQSSQHISLFLLLIFLALWIKICKCFCGTLCLVCFSYIIHSSQCLYISCCFL
jgi:hypothetical protein